MRDNRSMSAKIKHGFWSDLPKPFFILAPMANVTDFAFREMIAKYGKPDVMFTEFVSANGLVSAGRNKLLIDLKFSNKQRPIVAQLFTGHPEAMKEASILVKELGFDGLDINMGCPDRAVERQGGGAAMIKDRENSLKVLEAAREGAYPLPVSIKTRIGYNKNEIQEWLGFLLEQKLPALTIHLRTRKEMSDVPAHWDLMPDIVQLRNEISPETLIIGNGNIESLNEAGDRISQYGCDGVMIGRGIFGKPWLFSSLHYPRHVGIPKFSSHSAKTKIQDLKSVSLAAKNDIRFAKRISVPQYSSHSAKAAIAPLVRSVGRILGDAINIEDRLKIMLEHTKLFEEIFKGIKNFAVMKKHFKAYVSGWEGAKELRLKLMEAVSASQVDRIIKKYCG